MNEELRAQLVELMFSELRKAVQAKTVEVKPYPSLGEVTLNLKGLDKATIAAIVAAVS